MSIFEYDKEEEERKLRKAEYESGVADGFNDGINTAKKDTVRLHIAKSSRPAGGRLSGTAFQAKRQNMKKQYPLFLLS